MKTRMSLTWAFGVALSAGAIFDATAQDRLQPSPNRPDSGPAPSLSSAVGEHTNTTLKSVPPGAYVSPWLMDVIRLAQARIDDSIMLTFIDSAGTFNLDPDQIIYLRDLGLANEVITAMIQHDLEIISGLRQMPSSPSASPPAIHLNFVHSESLDKPPQTVSQAPAPDPAAVPAAPLDSASPLISEDTQPKDLTILRPDELATAPRMLGCQRQRLSRQAVSPVRQPYAVQLIDPIIMIRGQGRTPNLLVIELGP